LGCCLDVAVEEVDLRSQHVGEACSAFVDVGRYDAPPSYVFPSCSSFPRQTVSRPSRPHSKSPARHRGPNCSAAPAASLSIGATPDGPFGEKLRTPKDGTPWHDRVAARSLLSFSWRRPVRRAASVRVPFLLVVPDADSIAPVPAALEVARKAPGAELFRSAGGHYDVSRPSKHPAHRALHRTVAHALQEPLARLTPFCSVRCRVAAHRAGA
jgi:hypothetical protein